MSFEAVSCFVAFLNKENAARNAGFRGGGLKHFL